MKKLKRIAKKHDVIILLIAHPKKQTTIRATKEIMREDIAGSSNIGNLSDTIISYQRPGKNEDENDGPPREIKVLKNRWNNDKGVDGKTIPVFFDERSKRISESKKFDWPLGWQKEFIDIEGKQEEIPF